jgi:hypothetical protein
VVTYEDGFPTTHEARAEIARVLSRHYQRQVMMWELQQMIEIIQLPNKAAVKLAGNLIVYTPASAHGLWLREAFLYGIYQHAWQASGRGSDADPGGHTRERGEESPKAGSAGRRSAFSSVTLDFRPVHVPCRLG